MPTDTPDQQITLPVGADAANNPTAFTNFVADVEQRLVRIYTSIADRTARRASVAENELSGLADVNRVEVYDGTNDISLYARSLFGFGRLASNQTLTASSTVLQNVTGVAVTMPTAGTFSFRGVVYYDVATAADIKFAFTVPAGVSFRWAGIGAAAGGAASGDGQWTSTNASGTAIAYGGAGVGTVMVCQIEGEYVAGGTAGDLQLQAAQNTADASVSLVIGRSRLEVWRHA